MLTALADLFAPTLFHFYVWLLSMAIALSYFNLRRNDYRLTGMAMWYAAVLIGFHLRYFDRFAAMGLDWYVAVSVAQCAIALVAAEIDCMAARVIMPLAIVAVFLNLGTWYLSAAYPHGWYWWSMNIIQCAQITSLLFASRFWVSALTRALVLARKLRGDGLKRVTVDGVQHGPAG